LQSVKILQLQNVNICRHSATVNVDCWMTAVECVVYREIEKNIDLVNNLRRDKYIIEGKLKKYVVQNFTEQFFCMYFSIWKLCHILRYCEFVERSVTSSLFFVTCVQ